MIKNMRPQICFPPQVVNSSTIVNKGSAVHSNSLFDLLGAEKGIISLVQAIVKVANQQGLDLFARMVEDMQDGFCTRYAMFL